jgi:hypothetical protein
MILGLVSCRKDKTPPIHLGEDSECYTFPMLLQSYFVSETFMFKQPCFNPNNQNEFVYHFQDYSQNSFQLVKYNISTKQKTVLYQSKNHKIWGQPKWSKKGWIAFTRTSGYVDHIFIVKENGDSLKQFTTSTANYYPAWDPTGEYLYWAHTPFLGSPHFFLRRSLNGLITDTILMNTGVNIGFSTFNEISMNNILFSKTFVNNKPCIGKTALVFPPHPELIKILSLDNPNFSGLTGLTINNNTQDAYVTFYNIGLYKLNTNNCQLTLLIPFCHSKRYETISCSADGKFLIGERVDSRLALNSNGRPTGRIIEKSSIYLIDLITLKETKIELD